MMTLVLLTLLGVLGGAVGGAAAHGLDGLVIGASAGMVAGVSIWATVSMGTQWQRERRLDRYFVQNNQQDRQTRQ